MGDDVLPGLEGNHVSRVAAEAVDAIAAPEEEDLRHVGAELAVRIVQLHEIGPLDAPRPRGVETPVGFAAEPVGMMGLKRRGPARVVGRQVDEEQPFARMHRVDQLAELVERRRELVELRHRRIDRKEVRRRERASVLAHDGVGRRHGKRRQGLDDPEAHVAHDEVQAPGDLAKRTELTGKDRVDRIVRPRLGALDLDVQIASLGPLGHVRAFGEETRFAGKDADLVKRDLRRVDAGRRLRQRNVRPRAR